jgi:hypothetical protein
LIDEPDRGDDEPVADGACAEVAEDAEQIAEDLAAVVDVVPQDVLILKSLEPVLGEIRQCTCPDESPRVRYAADQAVVAICERVGRIMRRDLPVDLA